MKKSKMIFSLNLPHYLEITELLTLVTNWWSKVNWLCKIADLIFFHEKNRVGLVVKKCPKGLLMIVGCRRTYPHFNKLHKRSLLISMVISSNDNPQNVYTSLIYSLDIKHVYLWSRTYKYLSLSSSSVFPVTVIQILAF